MHAHTLVAAIVLKVSDRPSAATIWSLADIAYIAIHLVSYPDPDFYSSGWITSPLREKWVWENAQVYSFLRLFCRRDVISNVTSNSSVMRCYASTYQYLFNYCNMNRCKVCVAPVLECNKRRRLDSPQSEHCRALVGLACNVAIGITKNDAAI